VPAEEDPVPLNQFIDLYCERTQPGFWDEPANAISNLAFLVGALVVWYVMRRADRRLPAELRLLPVSMALVGIFSFLFHTLAVLWAAIADQLFILVFGCLFLYAFLRHCASTSALPAALVAVAFGLASYFTPRLLPPGWLNRSGGYLPYLIGLLSMAAWLALRKRPAARAFGGAIGVFGIALALRTVDQTWCDRFPLGTHFFWHLLNGGVLTILALALLSEVRQMR